MYLGDLPVAVLKARTDGTAANQAIVDVYNVYADHILTPRVITRASDNRMVWRWAANWGYAQCNKRQRGEDNDPE